MDAWEDVKRSGDRWKVIENLSGGGQGSISKVQCAETGRVTCLKTLSRQGDSERRARFFREATAYATFQQTGIPRLIQSNAHKHDDSEYKLFIVTEFVPGPTLTKQITEFGPIAFDDAVMGLTELLNIVEHLHSENWVHRDIKPDNIILRDSDFGKPVLLDFGLAYKDEVTPSFETEHGQEIGNRFIRLPELLAGSPVKQDVRSDLAFLGGIFFYLLTGVAPYSLIDADGRMPHQRVAQVSGLRAASGRAMQPLLGFFDRLFTQKINGRYGSVAEMRAALLDVVDRRTRDAMTGPQDDMEVILASLNSRANQEIARNKKLYDLAMNAIRSVHSKILKSLEGVYESYQTGYVNFSDGLRNDLGFCHFSTHNKKFVPSFLIRVIGEELVVYANDQVLHRTEVDAPSFGQDFQNRVQELYLTGLRALIEEP